MTFSNSPSEIADYFSYDLSTGHIVRLKQSGGKGEIGARADKPLRRDGYLCVKFKGRKVQAHRLAWFLHHGSWPEAIIDHVNGDPTDNRIENLRLADHSTNGANRKRMGKHLKGVTRCGDVKFRAQIQVEGKQLHLGTFDTEQEAHEAYVAAAEKYFGAFARSA